MRGYYQCGWQYRRGSSVEFFWAAQRGGRGVKTPVAGLFDSRREAASHFGVDVNSRRLVYLGPADMNSPARLRDYEMPWRKLMLAAMEIAMDDGNPNVRRSRKSGQIIFACKFPCTLKDGSYWPKENPYLADNLKLAREQMGYAGIEW